MKPDSSAHKLIEAIGNALGRGGYDETIRVLESVSKNGSDFNEEFELVIQIVAQEFGLTRKELLRGKTRHAGRRIAALECSAYILCEVLRFDRKDVSDMLNKHFTIISRYIKSARTYDSEHPVEKEKYDRLQEIKRLVFEHPYMQMKYIARWSTKAKIVDL